jgi:hypothetical protein
VLLLLALLKASIGGGAGPYNFYASCTAKLVNSKLIFFQRKVPFFGFVSFNFENLFFKDIPLSELQEMSITSAHNNSIT